MIINLETKDTIKILTNENLYISDNKVDSTADNFCSLNNSKKNGISWYKSNDLNMDDFRGTILIVPSTFEKTSLTVSIIKTTNPRIAFATILSHFFNTSDHTCGIHESVTIDENVKIGANCAIGQNSILKGSITIGDNAIINNNVTLLGNISIGDNVIIKSGSVIGSDGFGYFQKDNDCTWHKMQHIGGVTIHNNVHIGANSCIDRGVLENTIVGTGTKIDNLCHIAHNVVIGDNCMIIAHSTICGSVILGDNIWVAPHCVIKDNIKVANNVFIGMGSIVTKDVCSNLTIFGVPAKPLRKSK
jgi:UDP-3-O-[3-hydroxymyristoyl] glucosamine N-acyltransferase LpxD